MYLGVNVEGLGLTMHYVSVRFSHSWSDQSRHHEQEVKNPGQAWLIDSFPVVLARQGQEVVLSWCAGLYYRMPPTGLIASS
jgi:hypothetical protein